MNAHQRLAAFLSGDKLALARERISADLAAIAEEVFTPGMKLTFIARKPGNDEADLVITDDDLAEVAVLIERRRKADA